MNVPFNWLGEYIKISEDINTIAKYFTAIGYMQNRPVQKVKGDDVLDLEVRQNRPDCLSLVGLARELAAVMQKTLVMPQMLESLPESHGDVRVDIQDAALCYRMGTVLIEGIAIKESPKWMQDRLEACGVKVLNNIVDITNYVMIEIGLSMHAFDANAVSDHTISVREAMEGERITLFGGKKINFAQDDIILADSDGPISSTMMGGEAKSVSNSTTAIILEAAVYNQARVRRSSIRHTIRTESSTRLEKFLHPELVDIALRRAVHLVLEHAGGRITGSYDAYPALQAKKLVTLSIPHLHALTGVNIPHHTALDILNRLEIPTVELSEDQLQSEIPYFRTDLEQEADLIEEVIRIHGYDTIPEHIPTSAPPKDLQSSLFVLEEKARDIMIAFGYDEQISEPLTHEEEPHVKPVILENSLTSEKDMLRTTLDYSLIAALEMRKKYRQDEIALFEVGKIYFMAGEQYVEKRTLGGIAYGQKSYVDVKGDIEVLLERLGFVYHEDYVQMNAYDCQTHTFSINLEGLCDSAARFEQGLLSSPPSVIFHDFSFTVPEGLPVGEIIETIRQADPLVFAVKLGEMPRAQEDGTKTVFVKVTYQNPEGTLREEYVRPIKEKITKAITVLVSMMD